MRESPKRYSQLKKSPFRFIGNKNKNKYKMILYKHTFNNKKTRKTSRPTKNYMEQKNVTRKGTLKSTKKP